jgi:hypothetical protein
LAFYSVVNCQDSKGNYKVEVEKLIEAIQRSTFLKVGLSGTVAPSVDNDEKIELLEIPSEDEVKRFIEMAEENFQKIEDQNREFASKNNIFINHAYINNMFVVIREYIYTLSHILL